MIELEKISAPTFTHERTGKSLDLDAKYGEGCAKAVNAAYALLRLVPEDIYDPECIDPQWVAITPDNYRPDQPSVDDNRVLASFTLASPMLLSDPEFPGGAFFDFNLASRSGKFTMNCIPRYEKDDVFELAYEAVVSGANDGAEAWATATAELEKLSFDTTVFERYYDSQMYAQDRNPFGSISPPGNS